MFSAQSEKVIYIGGSGGGEPEIAKNAGSGGSRWVRQ